MKGVFSVHLYSLVCHLNVWILSFGYCLSPTVILLILSIVLNDSLDYALYFVLPNEFSRSAVCSNEVISDSEGPGTDTLSSSKTTDLHTEDTISFSEVDIFTPARKMLAKQLTCDIVPGKSLLVTG